MQEISLIIVCQGESPIPHECNAISFNRRTGVVLPCCALWPVDKISFVGRVVFVPLVRQEKQINA